MGKESRKRQEEIGWKIKRETKERSVLVKAAGV